MLQFQATHFKLLLCQFFRVIPYVSPCVQFWNQMTTSKKQSHIWTWMLITIFQNIIEDKALLSFSNPVHYQFRVFGQQLCWVKQCIIPPGRGKLLHEHIFTSRKKKLYISREWHRMASLQGSHHTHILSWFFERKNICCKKFTSNLKVHHNIMMVMLDKLGLW